MRSDQVYQLLEREYERSNQRGFISDDPISIPHRFTRLQDIEISAFFAAMLAWGQRVTIIRNVSSLMALMDHSPWQFMTQSDDQDLKPFLGFKHRTFNDTDLLYFIVFFRWFYRHHDSLESAFTHGMPPNATNTEGALIGFHDLFFSLDDYPQRTRKHIATPLRKSTCKRLNMFLRWMVRHDSSGVDFGLWQTIRPAQLLCPLDVHVEREARRLGLIERPQTDWLTVLELTESLRLYDPADPVKYDFALFGMGVNPAL